MWLTTTYFLHTIGELVLSPVGLSAMTMLAPARIGGLMMGVWFLATSVGNFIGGRVSGLYESFALPSLFGAVAGFADRRGHRAAHRRAVDAQADARDGNRQSGLVSLALVNVVLFSTYDLGRQPFGLASPAAWLRRAGASVAGDRSVAAAAARRCRRSRRRRLRSICPMHTATRLALPVIDRVRAINPAATICAYGLYASLNEELLRQHGVSIVLGPEAEEDLVADRRGCGR